MKRGTQEFTSFNHFRPGVDRAVDDITWPDNASFTISSYSQSPNLVRTQGRESTQGSGAPIYVRSRNEGTLSRNDLEESQMEGSLNSSNTSAVKSLNRT